MYSFFLQVSAGTSSRGRSISTSLHISHLTVAVEWWVGGGTALHLSAKHFLTLLTSVMVHRVMHGSLILHLRITVAIVYLTLIVGLTIAARPS